MLRFLSIFIKKVFWGARIRKIDLASGIVAEFIIEKNGRVSTIFLSRNFAIFKRINWSDTADGVDFIIGSFRWRNIVDFAKNDALTIEAGSFRYDRRSDRIVYNLDGEEFSIPRQDVVEIHTLIAVVETELAGDIS